jgi:hypothetical protein
MIDKVVRVFGCGVVVSAIVIAACGGQSAAPTIVDQPVANHNGAPGPGSVQMASVPAPAATIIAFGDAIGIPTWPAGDTKIGGNGSPVDGYACHPPPMDQPYHIHIHLDIFDQNGNQLQIPWGIGVDQPWTFDALHNAILSATCFYDLHTHDEDGVIHYESAKPIGALNLGYFFDVWGMPLSSTQVATLTGKVYVMYGTLPPSSMHWTSVVNPRTIKLSEHEFIYLAINNPPSKTTLPVYHWSY